MRADSYPQPPVPSLIDIVAEQVDDLTLATGEQLNAWLPGLPAPGSGWAIADLDAHPCPTRTIVHRSTSDAGFDGCEIINLLAFTGTLPLPTVIDGIAATLRAVAASNMRIEPLYMPPEPESAAATASGDLIWGTARMSARYSAYLILGRRGVAAGGHGQRRRSALVEHNIFTAAHAHPRLHQEANQMHDTFYETLIRALRQR